MPLFFLNFYPAAKNFGIRIRRLAEEVLIERADREQRRVNAVYGCGESDELVSAEIEFNGYVLATERFDFFFDSVNGHIYFNHTYIFDNSAKFMQKSPRGFLPRGL